MAQDKVSVANRALGKIGAKKINSFNEDSPSARAISSCYDDILDEVLSEHLWGFAQKRAVLALTTDTPVMTEDGMAYVFALPTDLIKINFTSEPGATIKVENGQLLSNVGSLKIIYTYRNVDPSTYFALFTTALVTRIASEICFALTESVKKSEALAQLYRQVDLPNACSVDSQQSTPTQINQDEWEYMRQVGGATMFVIPGTQVWHPVF